MPRRKGDLQKYREKVEDAIVTAQPGHDAEGAEGEKSKYLGIGQNSLIVREGLENRICELLYAGLPEVRIARRLGVGRRMLQNYMASERFLTLYENKKIELAERVDEAIVSRLQDIVLDAFDDMVAMRNKLKDLKRGSLALRHQINKDLIDFYEKFGKRQKKSGEGILEQIRERWIREKADGTTDVRYREITKEPARADDTPRGGAEARAVDQPGEAHRAKSLTQGGNGSDGSGVDEGAGVGDVVEAEAEVCSEDGTETS